MLLPYGSLPMNIKSKLSYFYQHHFVRNVVTLQAGSFAGSIVQALAGVFLARILQPERFGVYSLAFSLASLISLFSGLGVQDAVAQDAMATVLSEAHAQKDEKKIREAVAFLLKITFFIVLLALVGALFAPLIAKVLYHRSLIGDYASLIVLAVMIGVTFFSLTALVLRVFNRIKGLTVLALSDQVARYGLAVLLAVLGLGAAGAALGHLLGAVILFFVSLIVWEYLRRQYNFLPSLRRLIGQARVVPLKKYLNFSALIAIDRNLASLYSILPVFLAGIFVAVGEVAFFKLAFAYVNLALSLLGPVSVLLNVEFPKMRVEDSTKLARNFVKVSFYSLGLSLLLTAGALLAAPHAFRFFYGVNYLPSVRYVYGLFVYGALFGIGVGLGPMWRAVNKVRVSILINVVTLGTGVPLGLWLIKNYGLRGSVIMVTLWFTISHFVSFVYLWRALKSAPLSPNKNVV